MQSITKHIETARDQMERHQMQVSGAWSIDAQGFCKEAGVDYDAAVDYQIIRESVGGIMKGAFNFMKEMEA